MAQPLRYGTSADVIVGPIIKSTDGYNPLTGASSDEVSINFFLGTGKTTGDYDADNSFTEIAAGYYWLGLTTVESGQLGPCLIEVTASSGIPFAQEYTVIAQKTYDALIKGTGTDLLDVNIEQINGTTAELATGIVNVNVEQLTGTTLGSNVSSGYIQTDAQNVLTTASNVNIGALAGTTLGANVSSGYIQTDAQNVLTTASNVDIGAIAGTTIVDINDFAATGYAVDGARTLGEVYKGIAVELWGNTTYDGTTFVYYDAGGSSYWEAALASGYRTVTTV